MPTPLPVELLDIIISSLDDKEDILTCRLTSSIFRSIANPLAFRTLTIRVDERSKIAIDNLIDAPGLSELVREIVYRQEDDDDDGMIGVAASNFSHLAELPLLETVHMHFPIRVLEDWPPRPMTTSKEAQTAIFTTLASNPPPISLRRVEIHALLSEADTVFYLPGLSDFWKPIVDLVITTNSHDACEINDEAFLEFWSAVIPHCLQSCSSLASLTLDSDVICQGPNVVDWDDLTCPNLIFLRLKNMIFDDNLHGGLERFITRQGATLTRLELLSCQVDIVARFYTPFATRWADIWARFEQTLTHLETFTFHPMPGRPKIGDTDADGEDVDPHVFYGYIAYCGEGMYKTEFEEPPRDGETDRLAFEHLQDVIRARQNL
ncbi:hypothetical protein B0H34DRAFT_727215 [Crassisporium funariophilum]|nr:hypothetical protein B0H34DRAFT_727215 [Crassisporium funariophilum]